MVDTPYTQQRHVQYRGPSTSDDYNARIEENYKDLTVLTNKARLLQETGKEFYRRTVKEQADLEKIISDLESRVEALEEAANVVTFYEDSQDDTDRFAGGAFEVSAVDRCTLDSRHGILTLPKIDSSSLSKLQFTDTNGEIRLPSTLELAVDGVSPGADSSGAVVDTSPPEFAVRGGIGRIWERNVIVDAPSGSHAQMDLYVKVPTDLFTTEKSNVMTIHPFPTMGADIMDVSTTTKVSPIMTDLDGYTPINANSYYASNTAAIGWVPPGGWTGDEILRSGPKKFYFNPFTVTAFRIRFRQRSYYYEASKYIYSYGASLIDLGYDKFMSSGRVILRFDAPGGDTISNVTDVEPQIFNVAEAELPAIFSYRVIYETSFNSGVYTTTPVALSQRVWVEVTLDMTAGGGTPALSALTVSYT